MSNHDSFNLSAACDPFEAAWEAWKTGNGPLPDVVEYWKGVSGQREVLAELVALDLEYRWKAAAKTDTKVRRGESPTGPLRTELPLQPHLEDYVRVFPELGGLDQIPLELIGWEYRLRHSHGIRPTIEEFLARFPVDVASLRRHLDRITQDFSEAHDVRGDPPTTARITGVREATPAWFGRYRVVSELGSGGFGIVYRGYDAELERDVAIKVSRPDRLTQRASASAYREARTVAALDHPAIVPVYDVGYADDGRCYVVSKLIPGTDLAHAILEQPPNRRRATEIVCKVADALHHAHCRGLVHRDVKPANILIDAMGQPYLADFGLVLRDEDFGKAAGFVGTALYMSPEQARGEGHRVDGRSDIFSLGAVFYELLVRRRPFRGQSPDEVLRAVLEDEPRPLRQCDDTIPSELERICLKALSKRAIERYMTAKDLADDLQTWLMEEAAGAAPDEGSRHIHAPGFEGALAPDVGLRSPIVPKGLRSFDAHDADFFLALLPGPRDREGLPESIRFWKSRLEETDPDRTFDVGLLYGPSGSGKSSLVKAGILPRLAEHVVAVYVEATPDATESRILRRLARQLPDLPAGSGLAEALAALRRCAGPKIVLIVDQFEQWLHAHRGERQSELVTALRHCDGGKVQAVVMVRDDFWLAASRFMQTLEVPLLEGVNSALVDLFDSSHARHVLALFGRAWGRLPERGELSSEQERFLDQAIAELSQDGKVVSVRLSLFAEMVKSKPWTRATLKQIGGIAGVGATFLEETFHGTTAPPRHRWHQRAAGQVLQALLPDVGTDIKGHLRSHSELCAASGYQNRPADFADLLRVLDGQLRLIAPTDSEGSAIESEGEATLSYYQLTHDYLVPSLRDWLTRKQRESRRGRAELRLAERAALWSAKPEARRLPSVWEYWRIRISTDKGTWSPTQRKLMAVAARQQGLWAAIIAVALAFLVWGGYEMRGRLVAKGMVASLMSAKTTEVPRLANDLVPYLPWAASQLEDIAASRQSSRQEQLHARLALAQCDPPQIDYLVTELLAAPAAEVPVIFTFLDPHWAHAESRLREAIERPTDQGSRLRAATAWARHAPTDPRWKAWAVDVAADLVTVDSTDAEAWLDNLRPVGTELATELEGWFRDRRQERAAECAVAAAGLAEYLADSPERLAELVLLAESEREFGPLVEKLRNHPSVAIARLAPIASQVPPDIEPHLRAGVWRGRANAAVALLELDRADLCWPLLRKTSNPSLRSYLVERLPLLGTSHSPLIARLKTETDDTARRAIILALGGYDPRTIADDEREKLTEQLAVWYQSDPDPGIHSAIAWTLRLWRQATAISRWDARLQSSAGAPTNDRDWYINSQGMTMLVFQAPLRVVASIPTPFESLVLRRRIAVATTEVTVEQFQSFPGRINDERLLSAVNSAWRWKGFPGTMQSPTATG